MNLARALLSLPDEIEVTPWYDIRSEKKKSGTGRPKGAWKPHPDGLVEACAIVYFIGRITTPISYVDLADWANAKYGTTYHPMSIRLAITRFGKPRKQRPRGIPDHIILECAQLAIIQCAYGCKQPWMLVVDRLWIKYRINVTNHSVACTTREWMGAQR